MRSLREKLNAVAAPKTRAVPPVIGNETPFFCRESVVPMEHLRGIEQTTFEEIKACDPSFTADVWSPYTLLFLDTETTGLSNGAGTVAFEIGLGWLEPRGMVIRQYVMRDYHEEAAMLEEIAAIIRRFNVIVTFNGKSFDLPLLEARLTMNRIRLAVTSFPHFDLLHAARRVYKLRLGRCNLARLEEAVLDQVREDDLPGALVPQRYFDYLKTKEFALMEDVLRHNLQDVQSLAELTGHICAVFREPQQLTQPQDLLGVGKTLLRTGNKEKGRTCLRIIGCSSVSAQAHMVLALSYKKGSEWSQAVASWREMISRGEGDVWPYVEIAKYYEHIERDNERALSYAKHALSLSLNRGLLISDVADMENELRKRIARLQKKVARDQEKRG